MLPPIEPVIKWSGSKRSIAPFVAALFPPTERYIEPFVGGGSLLPFRSGQNAIAGDIIPELIELWNNIRDNPLKTAQEYKTRWERLQKEGHTAYYDIRRSFNQSRNPFDFLFLSRTCVNGLIRFNSDGDFNNSLHHTRPGIDPARLRRVIYEWSEKLQSVQFVCSDYRDTLGDAKKGDLVFLDPPYGGNKGRYAPEELDQDSLFDELRRLNEIQVNWVLTFDGSAGKREYVHTIPEQLYKVRIALPTGKSPFTRLMRMGIDTVVESVYLNFDPPVQLINSITKNRKQREAIGESLDMQQSSLFD